MPRHFLELDDFSRDELLDMLELIRILKQADRMEVTPRLLAKSCSCYKHARNWCRDGQGI